MVVSTAIILSILAAPSANQIRRVIATSADVITLTGLISSLGETGSVLMPLYMWIILGNGVRFGQRSMMIAILMSIIGTAYVFVADDYWFRNPYYTIGWVIGLVVLPLYLNALLRTLRDKTEELQRMYEYMAGVAHQDPLTGLPNRAAFTERLKEVIERSESHQNTFALAFVDIDGFKQVNDSHGHKTGDDVIIMAAGRLKQTIRLEDFAARLGGDEFVLLLPRVNRDAMTVLAERLVASMKKPFRVGGKTLSLSASIGVAMYPDDGNDIETLLRNADEAMYDVKKRGKDGYRIKAVIGC
jgi:diguanylate cyclase (GGDEF)-like protein